MSVSFVDVAAPPVTLDELVGLEFLGLSKARSGADPDTGRVPVEPRPEKACLFFESCGEFRLTGLGFSIGVS